MKQPQHLSTYATHDGTAHYMKSTSTQFSNSAGYSGFITETSVFRTPLLAFGVHSTRPSLSSPVATYSISVARALLPRRQGRSRWTRRRSYFDRLRPAGPRDQTITSAVTGIRQADILQPTSSSHRSRQGSTDVHRLHRTRASSTRVNGAELRTKCSYTRHSVLTVPGQTTRKRSLRFRST
jgi:hypothetical protein